MSLDASYIGRSFPPTEAYLVTRERIREFATAIGAESPLHRDPEAARKAGYRDVIAPLTFPILIASATLDQFLTDEALGIDFSRVVHGDERFVYHRPVTAGDEVTCVGTILDITARSGNEFFSTSTAITTTAGEPIVTTFSKLVIRGES